VSTSHPVGAPTSRNTIVIAWSGAFDQGSGVDGFSSHWDPNVTADPDTAKDAEEDVATATSPPLQPGTYYFHLRTRDNAGNWTAAVHSGPYVIRADAPPAPLRCVVPRLKGKTVPQARTALARAKCVLGLVRRVRVRRGRVGRVLSQSARAGTSRPRGTRVSVVVGRR
jgi:hypothetical protein